MYHKLYRYFFWIGYISVLILSFIPITGILNRIKVNLLVINLRLDHLHLSAYLLIYLYYLAGQLQGLSLFETRPLSGL